ncbi:protein RALF-like 34 [Zingiber officinale]|uniref:protein RALF-like 34 n=1 Tax=Zingiber officinale TaxID=94328 RepID=UPI001C4C6839|nr:protein RALF-like 34 [Zingiber officinale]
MALPKLLLFLLLALANAGEPQEEGTSSRSLVRDSVTEWPSSFPFAHFEKNDDDDDFELYGEEEEEEEEETEEELRSKRRRRRRRSHPVFLPPQARYFISYAALSANRVPCPPRSGRSYYTHNCHMARGPVHPYSRDCESISRCRR